MSTIFIQVPVSIHKPGKDYTARVDQLGSYATVHGNYDIEVIPPNTVFEIEEAEGRKLVAQLKGKVVKRCL